MCLGGLFYCFLGGVFFLRLPVLGSSVMLTGLSSARQKEVTAVPVSGQECRVFKSSVSNPGFQAPFCMSVLVMFQGICLNLHPRCSTGRRCISLAQCLLHSWFPAFLGKRNLRCVLCDQSLLWVASVVLCLQKKINLFFSSFFLCSNLWRCRRCCVVAVQTPDGISLLSYVFCLSVEIVNGISIYSLWLFEKNEAAGTPEQLFEAFWRRGQGTLYAFILFHSLEIIFSDESLKIDWRLKWQACPFFFAFKFCITNLLWTGSAWTQLKAFWQAVLVFILWSALILRAW